MKTGRKVRDLGVLPGPVLLFGGPCSNLEATRALRAWARARGIDAAHTICTGDVVAYCASPRETVAEIRDWGVRVVAGNCEQRLAAQAPGCGCGFAPGSTCDRLSAGWYAHAGAELGGDERGWMADLPEIATFTHAGRRHAVIHGGATEISRFLWPSSREVEFAEEVAAITALAGPVETVVAGHCGLAFRRRVAGVEWINAGAVGMPPNDGAPETRFALLEEGRASIHRLAYDHRAACAAMVAAGLTQGYERALVSGYWPSEDVLPPDLRRAARASG